MSNKIIRTRFAPSPTGYLHIGGLRTALYAYLFARQNNGKFILRIEDTDQTREVAGAVEKLISTFNNIGLDYDEGLILQDGKIVDKGEFGPYKQSQRVVLYQKHAEQLIAENKAYYCFCTPERLDEMRKDQQIKKLAPRYDRCCFGLSAEEIKQKTSAKMKKVVRFKIPEIEEVRCADVVKGEVVVKGRELDDLVLLKSDGFPTYHLAHIIDDHFMQISHVIRSDEWLSSLAKHILLWQAFGWEIPVYAHLPLILNPDKSKLSKRQGDVAVEDYLAKGYLPEALINFVALLGWNPGEGSEQEIFSLAELIAKFDLNKVNKSGAVFNLEKLDWMNGLYIRQIQVDDLTIKCLPYIKEWLKDNNNGFDHNNLENLVYLKKIVTIEQGRLKKLSDITTSLKFFFVDELNYDPQKLIWKKFDQVETKTNLMLALNLLTMIDESDFTIKKIESEFHKIINEKGIKAGNILWPVRYALSGAEQSPSPFELAWALGRNKNIERIKKAISLL